MATESVMLPASPGVKSSSLCSIYEIIKLIAPAMFGEAIDVPLYSAQPLGTEDVISPPWAEISGLRCSSGVGPQLEKSDMNGPAFWFSLMTMVPLPAFMMLLAASIVIEQVGIGLLMLPRLMRIMPETLL